MSPSPVTVKHSINVISLCLLKCSRHVYGCARSVACGDLLPVVLSDEASPIENQEISEHSDEHHASDDTCTKAKESDVPEACH